jgi:hypothetical protein
VPCRCLSPFFGETFPVPSEAEGPGFFTRNDTKVFKK